MRGLMLQCLAYHEGSQSLSSGSCFCHPYHPSPGADPVTVFFQTQHWASPHLVTFQVSPCLLLEQSSSWAIMAHNTTPNHCTEMPHGNNQASMAIQLEQGKAAACGGCLSHASETPKGFRGSGASRLVCSTPGMRALALP